MATRREAVRLDLEDHFTSGVVKAAGATQLLNRELNSLSGQAVKSNRSLSESEKQVTKTGNSAERSGKQIDKFSGRLAALAQAAAVLGPAVIPLGAAGIPAVAGLATELGVAASAAGVAVLAFHGLGDGLKALNAYQLEPTAENLAKMREQMDKLGPSGEHFVRFLDKLGPQLRSLQMAARDGLFPGMEDGITSLMTLLPQVRVIVGDLATAMGHLAADAGAGLAGDKFKPFFDYLQKEAAPTLEALGHTLGSFASGFANMIVAFGPLSASFVQGFEGMAASFADWAAHLDTNQGFQDFLDYLRESGPQALDFLGALVQAFAGIVKAAAPVGSTVLPILTELAKGLGALADSPVGPVFFTAAAGMVVFSRAASVVKGAMGGLNVSAERTTTAMTKLRSAGMALAALEAAGVALDAIERKAAGAAPSVDKVTESLIHINSADFAAQFKGLGDAIDEVNKGGVGGFAQDLNDLGDKVPYVGKALVEGGASIVGYGDDLQMAAVQSDKAKAAIDSLDQALAGVVASGSPDQARAMFANLAESQHLSAEQQAQLLDLLPKYGDALTGAKNQTDLAAGATDLFSDSSASAAAHVKAETRALQANINAMKAKRDAALGAFDAETQYAQALVEARKQGEKSEAGINLQNATSRKQRLEMIANREKLHDLAAAWNNQSDAVKNNVHRFKESRDAFIQTAEAMGVPEQAAKDLAKRILDIPKSHLTTVKADTDLASTRIQHVQDQLAGLHDKTVMIHVGTTGSASVGIPTHADGGLITGPGGPRDDKIPAMLSNREYVMPADAVEHYGVPMMEMLRARRFASGGLVAAGAEEVIRYRGRPKMPRQLAGAAS